MTFSDRYPNEDRAHFAIRLPVCEEVQQKEGHRRPQGEYSEARRWTVPSGSNSVAFSFLFSFGLDWLL